MKTKRTAEDLSAKRLLRRTLPAALVLLAVVLAFTAPAAADTSWYSDSSITFTLTTADQLAGLASLVNSGNTFEGKTVELGGDISISGDWTPIGNATATPFSGTFDGNGHVVSLSVTVDETTGGSASIPYGLFGANNGTIQNLGVAGSFEITSNNRVSCFGSIAGENQKNGVITNCFSSCYVSLTNSGVNSVIVGGIVGQNMGMLENSYAVGDVTATASGTYSYAGGIAGYNYHTILNCYAAGNVTVESSSTSSHAGGIAGICRPDTNNVDGKGNITNCFALNEKITAADAGRIAGLNSRINEYVTLPKLIGNSAWNGMTLNGATVADGTAADKNGADVASDAVWGKTFEPFTDAKGWKLNEGNENFQLPVLKNIAVPADVDASHLNPAVIPTPEPTPESYFSGGEGTGESPYLIASLSDLKNLSTLVNAATGTYNTSHYKLTAPVTLGSDWTPIGCYGEDEKEFFFNGVFDGNSKTITFGDVKIENYANSYYGVFGVVGENGEVTNLTVDGSLTISGSEYYYVGGIAGYVLDGGTITNSQSSVAVEATSTDVDVSVGGIVGWNDGTISDCSATGAVTAESPTFVYAGGIAGYNYGPSITDCSATGAVTANGAVKAYAGGIVGQIDAGTISNSYATGDVKAVSDTESYAGGIAGYAGDVPNADITISNSYALNNQLTSTGSTVFIGRVVGDLSSGTLNSNYAWNGMKLNGATVTGGTAADENGADVASAAVWNNQTTWAASGFDFTDVWEMGTAENFLLPVLKNLPAPANADASHLIEAAPTYTITFDENGGTEVDDVPAVPAGSTISAPTEPTKVGYTFNGWYKEAGLTNLWDFDTDTVTADTTLYAKWTANTSTVQFNANGGEGTMADQLFTYDVKQALTANTFTRTGYTFAGWAKTADGAIVYTNSEEVSNLAVEDGAVVTLYAQWTINQYTITFNANGGTGEMALLTINHGDSFYLPENTFTAPDGREFAVWCDQAAWDEGAAYSVGWEVENVVSEMTFYAQWSPKTYYITFNTNGGTPVEQKAVEYNATIFVFDEPTKEGYTFTGWSPALPELMPAENLTVTAQWKANTYTVEFHPNGGEGAVSSQKFTYDETAKALTANSFTRTGYTFAGWAKTADGVKEYEDKASVQNLISEPNGKFPLYAVWTVKTLTVTFHNGSSGTDTQELTYGSDTKLKANPFTAPADKVFGGWATDSSGYPVVYGDKAEFASVIAGELTTLNLYANWTSIPPVYWNVTFNDGTTSVTEKVLNNTAAGIPSVPTKVGYTFNGWNKGNVLFDFDTLITEDITLVANWTANTYTVKFDANSGTGSMAAQSFTYDVEQALTANTFTRTGYTFAGWATAETGNKVYNNNAPVKNLASENGAVVTLYAVWTENSGSGGTGGGGGGGTPAPSTPSTPSTPTTPTTPEVPDTPKVTSETKEIPTAPENTETLPTGDKVVVVTLENTEVIQSVAVPEAVAQANPEASVKVTEGGNAPALPENVAADDVHIVVGVSVVDKEGNPVKITESGYFILDADVPAGKKLVVGHYKNDIWVDCLVEDLGNGHYKVHYNGLSPFAAVIIEEHEESPFAAEEKPTEKPAETPAPILGMVLGGLAAAVVLRRK